MIIRPYIETEEDRAALLVERCEDDPSRVLPSLQEIFRRYRQDFSPYLVGEKPATKSELGKGNIGIVTLFEPEDKEAFVQKVFRTTKYPLIYKGLSAAQMNFRVDAKIARALRSLPIAPQLLGGSYIHNELISAYRRGSQIQADLRLNILPQDHTKKLVQGVIDIHTVGVTVDNNPSNVLYDKCEGFCIVDAVPSSRLITPLPKEEHEDFSGGVILRDRFDHSSPTDPTDYYDCRLTTWDRPLEEHLFSAAKFMTYVLSEGFPYGAKTGTEDHSLHYLGFQRVFLPCLYEVLGIVKEKHPDVLGSLFARTSTHLENLGKRCEVGSGWTAGLVEYKPEAPGKALSDQPEVKLHIEKIKRLMLH